MSTEVRTQVAGAVYDILVAVGDSVEAGETVALVESMKMEVPVIATGSGTVQSIAVTEGDSIDTEAAILTLD